MKKTLLILLGITVLSAVIFSCNPEEAKNPSIALTNEAAYTQDGDTVDINETIRFRITANGESSNITNIVVSVNCNNVVTTRLDSGMNAMEIDKVFSFPKTYGSEEIWTITVMNKDRLTSSASFTIIQNPNSTFGDIRYLQNVKIGMQDNTTIGHFVSTISGNVYTEAECIYFTDSINILGNFYVSGGADSYTLQSPGSEDAPNDYPNITSWANQNYTLYDYYTADDHSITASMFDAIIHDSLITNGFNELYGNRKCKFCSPGDVIPFWQEDGKKGLIKVVETSGEETGYMVIDIKIQK